MPIHELIMGWPDIGHVFTPGVGVGLVQPTEAESRQQKYDSSKKNKSMLLVLKERMALGRQTQEIFPANMLSP